MLELGAKFEQDMLGVLEADEIQEFKESLMEFAGNTTAVIANNVNSTVSCSSLTLTAFLSRRLTPVDSLLPSSLLHCRLHFRFTVSFTSTNPF